MDVAMPIIAVISQKGGAGKATLALYPAAAPQEAGAVSLIIDTDPHATASQRAAWRRAAPSEVIDSPPPRLAAKVEQAIAQWAELIVINTPPHADSAGRAAVEVTDLVLIPCCPNAFDLSPILTIAKLVQLLRKPAFVAFTAASPNAPASMLRRASWAKASARRPARRCCPITPPKPIGHVDRSACRQIDR
jgi:chromosome partitioning protein